MSINLFLCFPLIQIVKYLNAMALKQYLYVCSLCLCVCLWSPLNNAPLIHPHKNTVYVKFKLILTLVRNARRRNAAEGQRMLSGSSQAS